MCLKLSHNQRKYFYGCETEFIWKGFASCKTDFLKNADIADRDNFAEGKNERERERERERWNIGKNLCSAFISYYLQPVSTRKCRQNNGCLKNKQENVKTSKEHVLDRTDIFFSSSPLVNYYINSCAIKLSCSAIKNRFRFMFTWFTQFKTKGLIIIILMIIKTYTVMHEFKKSQEKKAL